MGEEAPILIKCVLCTKVQSLTYPQFKVVCNEKWPWATTLKKTKRLAITDVTLNAEIDPYFFLLPS